MEKHVSRETKRKITKYVSRETWKGLFENRKMCYTNVRIIYV